MGQCGKAIEGRTHVVGECETYKEDERDMEGFRTLLIDSSEKTVAIISKEMDGSGHRRRIRKGV